MIMRHSTILIALLALLPLAAVGQVDTAARIVDRYEQLLGVDRLPQDSMLTMVTPPRADGTKENVASWEVSTAKTFDS